MKTEKSIAEMTESELIDALKYNSSRHHYIPKFLLNGFTNADGKLFIYDKKNNKIQRRPAPPKSIFYERDRNTIELPNTVRASFIEDSLYSGFDNDIAPMFNRYQRANLTSIEFPREDQAKMLFFLITLFWRIPKTDFAAACLLNRSSPTIVDRFAFPFQSEAVYQKVARSRIFEFHINEIQRSGYKENKVIDIHELAENTLVIGDYPFLRQQEPRYMSEFNSRDLLMAVSSRRIYSWTRCGLKNFDAANANLYNAAVIYQSVRFVAAGDLAVLEDAVERYHSLKKSGLLDDARWLTFHTK